MQCEKRHPTDRFLCSYLSNAAALCFVSVICSSQLEDVQTYCSSKGTEAKRKLCKRAQDDLDACMIAHQKS
ncbi:hypothetical protein KP509_32G010900 [Ceratopteris richardii]|nr:hypothetical protein KP509_32G010900 [Ceratopteris richardii]